MEELDLKELFSLFWNKKGDIIIMVVFFIVIGSLYSFFFVIPKYKSNATLVLTQSSSQTSTNEEGTITQSDLTLNSKLVSTYSELIKSNLVLREVINNLNISSIEIEDVRKNVNVSAVSDTELIKITVTNTNPAYATRIANEITNVFGRKIKEIYNIDNVYVVDKAEQSDAPYNINHGKDIIIFAFIGIIIGICYVLIANMLDTTIKSEQDIEKMTGLLVLSSIPDYNLKGKAKKGGKR